MLTNHPRYVKQKSHLARGAPPTACGMIAAHAAMASSPWGSPWVRKFGGEGARSIHTITPPLLPSPQALGHWIHVVDPRGQVTAGPI